MRTKLIDDLILVSVAEGCDRVLNLAAGFDTRPYRLPLPSGLLWIEADLPQILAEKERLLSTEKPVCELRRERVDLLVPSERSAFLSTAISGAARTLVLTEGLLVYLEDEIVRSIGCDLAAQPDIRWWILDLSSPAILHMMQKQMGDKMDNAPLKFAPPNGIAFFEALGWKARDIQSLLRSAARFKRVGLVLRFFSRFPEPDLRNLGKARWGGIVRLEK
jgi:methyltransferase (TIGR00027 family)